MEPHSPCPWGADDPILLQLLVHGAKGAQEQGGSPHSSAVNYILCFHDQTLGLLLIPSCDLLWLLFEGGH